MHEALLYSLSDMCLKDDADSIMSENWLNAMDRGGLFHVIEMELRQYSILESTDAGDKFASTTVEDPFVYDQLVVHGQQQFCSAVPRMSHGRLMVVLLAPNKLLLGRSSPLTVELSQPWTS